MFFLLFSSSFASLKHLSMFCCGVSSSFCCPWSRVAFIYDLGCVHQGFSFFLAIRSLIFSSMICKRSAHSSSLTETLLQPGCEGGTCPSLDLSKLLNHNALSFRSLVCLNCCLCCGCTSLTLSFKACFHASPSDISAFRWTLVMNLLMLRGIN